jgi:hypothetical protein
VKLRQLFLLPLFLALPFILGEPMECQPITPPKVFGAWSQAYSAGPIPSQTFTVDARQSRQFIDWYVPDSALTFARAHPGQLYIDGDEPDQYCTAPSEYADIYHGFVEAIRSADPTARFSPSGFAEPNHYCCPGDSLCAEMHSISYAQKFYDSHIKQFGTPPRVNEWRFHDFAGGIATGDTAAWWARVDQEAAWSVAHGANMVLGSWGFLGWDEPSPVLQEQVKWAKGRLRNDSRINGAVWWSLEPWVETAHPLKVNGTLTSLGQTYADSTPTIAQLKASLDSLRAEVVKLRRDVGPYGDSIPPSTDFAHNCFTLPNSRYTVFCRVQQIGQGIDANNISVAQLGVTVAQLNARVNNFPSHLAQPDTVAIAVSGPAAQGIIAGFGSGVYMQQGDAPAMLFTSDYDHALRLISNFTYPHDGGSTYGNPFYPQQRIDFEQGGVISLGYFKPWATPAGDWDNLGGKNLNFRVGGQVFDGNGQRGKYADIYTGLVGAGLRFGLSNTFPNYPDRYDVQIDPDPLNPVSITLAGGLRQLRSCNIGGITVVCYGQPVAVRKKKK